DYYWAMWHSSASGLF
nr:immunoglobulin light chain junction region [Macaca mulatta]